MSRILTVSSAVLALALAGQPASAADYFTPAPTPTYADWEGLYIGLGAGGRWDENNWTTTCLQPITFNVGCTPPSSGFPVQFATGNPSTFDPSGFRFSGYAGYNWQVHNNWIVGVEGDFGWADNDETQIGIPGTYLPTSPGLGLADTATVTDEWDASLRGRLGVLAHPDLLIYATGGVSFLEKEVSATCAAPVFPIGWCAVVPQTQTDSATHVGYTVGGGLEWMFHPNWIMRGEYRYSDYGSESYTFFAANPIDSFSFNVDASSHTAYGGISYLF